MKINEEAKVAVFGAGVSGLTLATFLQRGGDACVVVIMWQR